MSNQSMAGRRYLFDQESVLQTARPHPVVLARPFGWWLLAILISWVAGSAAVGLGLWPAISDALGWAAAAVTAYAALRTLRWWRTRYIITDRRVLVVTGILSAKVRSFPLAKVTETAIHRSVAGRLLRYGDLLLRLSDGETGVCRLQRFPRPKDAYRLISSLVARAGDSRPLDEPEEMFADPSLEETGRLPWVIL